MHLLGGPTKQLPSVSDSAALPILRLHPSENQVIFGFVGGKFEWFATKFRTQAASLSFVMQSRFNRNWLISGESRVAQTAKLCNDISHQRDLTTA